MGIISFNEIASSENAARKYFLGFCWKNHQRYCPRCRERKLYKVLDGKRRCARCHYTFHDFSQRFIRGCGFTFQQWLWFLKLFELNVHNQQIANQLKVSYATVLKAKDVLRRAILAQAPDAAEYYELGGWPGPGRPRPEDQPVDSPVFGIMEFNGFILCDVLPHLDPESLFHFRLNFRLAMTCLGQVVYTAPYQQYFMLVCCGPSFAPIQHLTHKDGRLPADSHEFWGNAKQHLQRMRGVVPAHFPLYLKEWELRHNYRDQSLVPILASALCSFVPQPPATGEHPNPDRH